MVALATFLRSDKSMQDTTRAALDLEIGLAKKQFRNVCNAKGCGTGGGFL